MYVFICCHEGGEPQGELYFPVDGVSSIGPNLVKALNLGDIEFAPVVVTLLLWDTFAWDSSEDWSGFSLWHLDMGKALGHS